MTFRSNRQVFQRNLSLLLLSVILIASGVRAADAQPRLLATLQGYEWQLDRAALLSLPADAWQGFMALAEDSGQSGIVRARAAASLVVYPNDSVWDFFVQAIGAADGPAVNRRRSVESLCAAFGAERATLLVPVLLPLLDEADAHLRIQAANCLQQLDLDSPPEALLAYRRNIVADWERRATQPATQPATPSTTPDKPRAP